MDPEYLEAIKAALQTNGTDTSDLERLAELAKDNISAEAKSSTKFVKPPRDLGGIKVYGIVVSVTGTGKKSYKVLIWKDFSKTSVSDEFGKKVDMYQINLNIFEERKMTDEQKREHDRECDANKDPNGKKREYKISKGGTIELHVGSIVDISPFDHKGYSFSSNRGVKVGDLVTLNSLTPKVKFKTPDAVVPSFKLQWWIPEPNASGMQQDTQHSEDDVVASLYRAISHNEIVNVGSNGYRSPNNETPYDRSERERIESLGKVPGWGREVIIHGQLPQNKRHIMKKALIVPLEELPPTPEGAAGQGLVISKLKWSETFKVEKGETEETKEKKREAAFVCDGKMFDEEGYPITAKIQVQLREDQIDQFGIVNPDRWAKLAPFMVANARGVLASHLWAGASELLSESQEETNTRNEDGTYPMGYAYSLYYSSDYIHVNLPSTLLGAGFEINAECAAALMNEVYKTTDFVKYTPEEVELYAKDERNIFKHSRPPVINLFEATQRLDDLTLEYSFIMLANVNNKKEDVVDIVDDLKAKAEETGENWVDLQSDLIMCKTKERGWPVRMTDSDLVFTIFAVRTELLEQARKPIERLSPEEFAVRYAVALGEQKEINKKRKAIAQDLAAINALPADVFDGPPQANNPGSPPPAHNPGSPPQEEDDEEPEPAPQKPKRRKTRKTK